MFEHYTLAGRARGLFSSHVLAAIVLATAGSSLVAEPTPLTGVIDRANVMNPRDTDELNRLLSELEQRTGAQLKVLTIQTTGGRDIHDIALQTAKDWRLGIAKKNNGCLIVVAVQDRRYRFETGEGIEGALPDLLCNRIAETYFVPNFRNGDYSKGILQGVSAAAGAIAAEYNVKLTGGTTAPPPSRGHGRRGRGGIACGGVPMLIFFLLLVSAMRGRRRSRSYGTWGGGGLWQGMLIGSILNNMGRGGGGSSWGGGGGFGGGSGGGFGGGGGGSFGGGGASGGW